MKRLNKDDKIYRATKAGLILQISTILEVTEKTASTAHYKFVREYSIASLKVINKPQMLTRFSIETPALKKQWQKQILFKNIQVLLSVDVDFEKLEAIYGILKK